MDPDYRRMMDFLVGLGTDAVPHTGEKFLGHLIRVHRDLESWGCGQDVCRAGLFHSIYGTEKFQRFSLPVDRRPDVEALIGRPAELLAYVNCFMDRASFDTLIDLDGPYRLRHRVTGEPMELDRPTFDDLGTVHLCDWLEQVPRSQQWDYRREAYRRLSNRFGGVAQEAYDRVFAQASP